MTDIQDIETTDFLEKAETPDIVYSFDEELQLRVETGGIVTRSLMVPSNNTMLSMIVDDEMGYGSNEPEPDDERYLDKIEEFAKLGISVEPDNRLGMMDVHDIAWTVRKEERIVGAAVGSLLVPHRTVEIDEFITALDGGEFSDAEAISSAFDQGLIGYAFDEPIFILSNFEIGRHARNTGMSVKLMRRIGLDVGMRAQTEVNMIVDASRHLSGTKVAPMHKKQVEAWLAGKRMKRCLDIFTESVFVI